MSIVLNEYEWAEQAINDKVLSKNPYEMLSRIAKYYTYKGYSHRDVRRLLDEFLLQCDPAISLVSWSDVLDRAARDATKYPIVMIEGIDISVPEMKRIDSLSGRPIKRLAFTLLCIAKYMHSVSEKTNYWVTTPDNEIMKMSNISTSIKRQSSMFGQLRDAGMIRFSKKIDNLSVQVLFVEQGDVAIRVTDFRNLGYQYMRYHGEPYFECAHCGITDKIRNPSKGRPQKYCPQCAAEIQTIQKVNYVMRNKTNMCNIKQ